MNVVLNKVTRHWASRLSAAAWDLNLYIYFVYDMAFFEYVYLQTEVAHIPWCMHIYIHIYIYIFVFTWYVCFVRICIYIYVEYVYMHAC